MKRVFVAVFFVSTISWAQSSKTPGQSKSGDIDFSKLFSAKCVICHGKDAKGSPAMARAFHVDRIKMDLTGDLNQKKADTELKRVITEGNGKMPSFKGSLSEAEIASAVTFIRSLARVSSETAAAQKTDAKVEKK